mmetsp:Transcript_40471/g.88816  ORF Transcript_40471/g.88816 Transcript_40471/m.88816 type:complete len:367 (-) Transcript_40471:562-1662(-)
MRALHTTRPSKAKLDSPQKSGSRLAEMSRSETKTKGSPTEETDVEFGQTSKDITADDAESKQDISRNSSDWATFDGVRVTKRTLEEDAAEQLKAQALSFVVRARKRAQDTQRRKELELRLTGRGVSADAGSLRMSSPVKCCDDDSISRTNSMVTGQRKLMRQLMAIDSSIDVSHIIDMMDEQSMPREAATPRASAHGWLSKRMAEESNEYIDIESELSTSSRTNALSRARKAKQAAQSPSQSFVGDDAPEALARARRAKQEAQFNSAIRTTERLHRARAAANSNSSRVYGSSNGAEHEGCSGYSCGGSSCGRSLRAASHGASHCTSHEPSQGEGFKRGVLEMRERAESKPATESDSKRCSLTVERI